MMEKNNTEVKLRPDPKFLLVNCLAQEMPAELPTGEELEATCRRYDAIGLAANQLGKAEPWFYLAGGLELTASRGVGVLCIKPDFIPVEKEGASLDQEGCVSLPGRSFVVKRYNAVKVTYHDRRGARIQRRLTGFAARVFQHEFDHLRGLTLEQTAEYEVR